MFSELEIEYKMAENLIESEISPLNDLSAELYQCKDLLRNPLIWGDEELLAAIESRIWQTELLIFEKEQTPHLFLLISVCNIRTENQKYHEWPQVQNL
jgi:hypothetical protein